MADNEPAPPQSDTSRQVETQHEEQSTMLDAAQDATREESNIDGATEATGDAYNQAAPTVTPISRLGHQSALIDCPVCTERNWTLTQDTEDDCGMFYVCCPSLVSLPSGR